MSKGRNYKGQHLSSDSNAKAVPEKNVSAGMVMFRDPKYKTNKFAFTIFV